MNKKHKNKPHKHNKTHKVGKPVFKQTSHNKEMPRKATPTLFGIHAVREAWLNKRRRIKALYITDTTLESFSSVIDEAKAFNLSRPTPEVMDKTILDKLLPREAVHQGIALVCDDLDERNLDDLLIKAANKERAVFLILDQVTDPHNVGALIRSACAFGADGVIMQRRHAPELTGVLAKTACGGVEHIDVAYETNLSRSIEELQENGYMVFGLDERGEVNIGELDVPPRSALVLGAEGPGLRRLVAEKCDQLVRLPTGGPIASLNVSNAGAVALYALKKP